MRSTLNLVISILNLYIFHAVQYYYLLIHEQPRAMFGIFSFLHLDS